MIRWIPFVVCRGPEIEARDRVEALEIAMHRHGADLVRVQSVASAEIAEEELAAAERERVRREGML